jgi:hypothetical protein
LNNDFKKYYPWRTGYGVILGLVAILWLVIAGGAIFIEYLNPEDKIAPFFMLFGFTLFWITMVLQSLNGIIEKRVNRRLGLLEYFVSFDSKYNLIDNPEDPLISLYFEGKYVSRHNDDIYTADLTPLALGVSIYIFRNSKDIKKNFCVVYSRFDSLSSQFQAFRRSE